MFSEPEPLPGGRQSEDEEGKETTVQGPYLILFSEFKISSIIEEN